MPKFSHISIPYGAIKREFLDHKKTVFAKFQFLMVRLKVEGSRKLARQKNEFQFLMVRLKVKRVSFKRIRILRISIPYGAIKRDKDKISMSLLCTFQFLMVRLKAVAPANQK